MKKIILVAMVWGSGYALSAQITVAYTTPPVSSNNTYIVPQPVHANFQTAHPGITMTTWEPMNGWWRSTYKEENNRITYLYYSTQPYYLVPVPDRDVNFKVALPVSNTYIPEEVIAVAIERYGANLYSITSIIAANNGIAYQISLLENGNVRTVWINPEKTELKSF